MWTNKFGMMRFVAHEGFQSRGDGGSNPVPFKGYQYHSKMPICGEAGLNAPQTSPLTFHITQSPAPSSSSCSPHSMVAPNMVMPSSSTWLGRMVGEVYNECLKGGGGGGNDRHSFPNNRAPLSNGIIATPKEKYFEFTWVCLN